MLFPWSETVLVHIWHWTDDYVQRLFLRLFHTRLFSKSLWIIVLCSFRRPLKERTPSRSTLSSTCYVAAPGGKVCKYDNYSLAPFSSSQSLLPLPSLLGWRLRYFFILVFALYLALAFAFQALARASRSRSLSRSLELSRALALALALSLSLSYSLSFSLSLSLSPTS